jgi:acyl-ACP thioesterase
MANIWTEQGRVRASNVTPAGTASVLTLATSFQEAAGHHAAELGVSMQDLLAEGRAWVLARLQLEVERLPRWEEAFSLETWPSGLDRLFAKREVVFRDRNEQVLARGTSAWLVIDTERRRPVRPPAALYDIETPDRPAPLGAARNDLPAPERRDRERCFTVRYHDVDLNRHVNNVRYLEWALETLPPSILDRRPCMGLALQFEAEATYADPIRATAQIDEDADSLRVQHRLAHAEDDRTLAIATTTWGAEVEKSSG